MIVLRRIFAVLFIFLFVPLFIASIVIAQVNSTVFSAGFYVSQLRKADVFNWAYDSLLPAAFDQASQEWQDQKRRDPDSAFPVDPKEVQPQATNLLKTTLPPEWLQEQAENVLLEGVPYVVGDTDEFSITIPLQDPIENLGEGIKDLASDPEMYVLITDEVMAPEVDEALEGAGDLPLGIRIQGDDAMKAFKVIVTQEWLEGVVLEVIDEAVPYATGENEHFTVVIPIGDRIEAAGPVLEDLLAASGAYKALESQEFRDAVQKQLGGFGALPFGLTLTADQIASAASEVATPEWLQARTEAAVDDVTPYLAGKQDSFVILIIPLKDRIIAALPVAKRLLQGSGAYEKAIDQVVETLLKQSVSAPIALPLGSSVTPDEVKAVLRQALPPEFVRQQAEGMIDEAVPFLVGDRAGFRIVVPLEQPKEQALVAIESLVKQKLQQQWDALPRCSFSQATDLLKAGSLQSIPTCRPAGFTLDEMKQALNLTGMPVTEDDIARQVGVDKTLLTQGVTFQWLLDNFGGLLTQQVRQSVGGAVPKEFVYTDADLRKTLNAEHERLLDQALGWAKSGYRFTDADLRKALGGERSDTVKRLDDLRRWSREGVQFTDADLWEFARKNDPGNVDTYETILEYARNDFTFTQDDLREAMESGNSAGDFETFNDIRDYLELERKLRFVAYLIPVLLLLAIAFLGGRSWRGRLAWGASALLIPALLAFIIFGVVYTAVAWPLIDGALQDAARDATGVQLVAMEKAQEVAASLSDAIVGGMARRSLVFLVIAVIGLAAVIFWRRLAALAKRFRPTQAAS